jgi:hypothetical protein
MANTINADNGVVSTVPGLKYSADTSGVLILQTNTTNALTLDTTQGATFSTGALVTNPYAGSYSSGMVLDHTTSLGRISVGTSSAIAFYNGGISARVETMRIDANGLVGIGLTPSGATVKLQVSTDALISGLTVGKGLGSVATNTVVGASALATNTSGNQNSAFGSAAMNLNTTGSSNVALGQQAMYYNTTGSSNVAIGQNALVFNTTASNNTAVGYQAGYSNVTGANNFFGGYQAGYSNTSDWNTAIGHTAGYSNTTGKITAVGSTVLQANTTGTSNVGVGGYDGSGGGGLGALYANTTGGYNTAIGVAALKSNTTASNNTAVGYQAGYSNTTGTNNTFVGFSAGYTNATGSGNTIVGRDAGRVSTAGNNTFFGFGAGETVTTGTQNTFIGGGINGTIYGAGSAVTTGSKNTILGSYTGNQGGLDIRTASNYIVLSDGDGNPRVSIPTGTATATIPNATGTVMVSGNMPTFRAYSSAIQNLSAATATKILYQQEEWDTNNNFASSRFTPTVAGYYFISAGTRTGNAGGTEFVSLITKNGTTYAHGSNNSATGINLSVVSTLVYMNGSTDYLEINVYPGPNACATQDGSAYVYFTGFLARTT